MVAWLGPLDRAKNLILARSLRAAEQALLAVVLRAIPLFADGNGPFALIIALMRCRMLIVLPTARRMAAHDPEKRLVDDIAQFIVEKAQFIDGRAVIDQALASELPSPYADEAVPF